MTKAEARVKNKAAEEVIVVDISDEQWKVRQYLREWCELFDPFDIANAYFETSGHLDFDGGWPGLFVTEPQGNDS